MLSKTCKKKWNQGCTNHDEPKPERMRWRKKDDYYIESDKGFKVSKASGIYTAWAPSRYRVAGVKVQSGFIGFHWTGDGKEAKEACQKLFANPEDSIPVEQRRVCDSDRGEMELSRKDQAGPVRVHRHSGPGQVDDSGHSDLFAQ